MDNLYKIFVILFWILAFSLIMFPVIMYLFSLQDSAHKYHHLCNILSRKNNSNTMNPYNRLDESNLMHQNNDDDYDVIAKNNNNIMNNINVNKSYSIQNRPKIFNILDDKIEKISIKTKNKMQRLQLFLSDKNYKFNRYDSNELIEEFIHNAIVEVNYNMLFYNFLKDVGSSEYLKIINRSDNNYEIQIPEQFLKHTKNISKLTFVRHKNGYFQLIINKIKIPLFTIVDVHSILITEIDLNNEPTIKIVKEK
uniref:ODV-E66-like protein n=1 Tax=Drosophila-associated filamentous virus TaxID=2743186 RepID=A0A6M9U0C5_9VIRU|nr:ODV-E66-like protein [Drosophila-associated filamentous virus]